MKSTCETKPSEPTSASGLMGSSYATFEFYGWKGKEGHPDVFVDFYPKIPKAINRLVELPTGARPTASFHNKHSVSLACANEAVAEHVPRVQAPAGAW